jgi:hypothetical protein
MGNKTKSSIQFPRMDLMRQFEAKEDMSIEKKYFTI